MVFDATGAITKPLQPAFLAQASSNQDVDSTSTTDVVFDTEKFDLNADYATPTFTAPVTGKYFLAVEIDLANAHAGNAGDYVKIELLTSNTSFQSYGPALEGGQYFHRSFSIVCDMDSSDTAKVRITHSTDTDWSVSGGAAGASTFSGCLLA